MKSIDIPAGYKGTRVPHLIRRVAIIISDGCSTIIGYPGKFERIAVIAFIPIADKAGNRCGIGFTGNRLQY
jgi:hypothetical protein